MSNLTELISARITIPIMVLEKVLLVAIDMLILI